MNIEEVVEGARRHAWVDTPVDELGGDVTTMLSLGERQMLHWLAKHLPLAGCIVDAGAFLGGSTLALASGLARNRQRSTIHCYDMFVAPNDAYSLGLIGHGRKPGDSVLDLFQAKLGAYEDIIVVNEGDFISKSAPDGEIDLLFIDIAKTWELNQRVNEEYFSKLVPGRSLVIQQDTNDQSCPWVNITMEYFSEYFDAISDDGASRLFLYVKQIPDNVLRVNLQKLPAAEKLHLMDASAERASSPDSEFLCRTCKAWIIFETSGASDAIEYLQKIQKDQPWSGEPYTLNPARAIAALKDVAGFKTYIDGFFKGQ
jgi:hypothetical protein